jgi:hypothetical protein
MNLATFSCISFIFVVLAVSIDAGQPDASPMPLAVVHTRAELMEQTPLTFNTDGVPVTYRLGIDDSDAKLYGGVVLYCLAESGKPVYGGQNQIGPFRIDVQTQQSLADAQTDVQNELIFPNDTKQIKELLYTMTIPLRHSGDYTITVKEPVGDPKGAKFETIATTTVKVSGEPGPIWSPWPLNAANGAVGLLARDDDRDYSAMGVSSPSAGVAIPKMFEWLDTEADPTLALPQLFPSAPDPGVQLQLSGSLLIVTLDHGIQPQFPDEKFLSRWWINGKPFIPKLEITTFSGDLMMRHNGAMRIDFAKRICFQVEFHPEVLGAKKGDEIGVQLLLCPQGSEGSGPSMQMLSGTTEMNPAVHDVDSLKPRMSNRVTFIYTGDPLRMAKP